MAPKGVISAHDGGFQVEFPNSGSGEQVVIEPLGSEEEAALVCDALTIMEAMDARVDPASLQLRSMQGPPRLDLLGLRCGLEAASFQDVVLQLSECAAEAEDMEPKLHGRALLVAALDLGHKAAAQLLVAAAPAAAAAEGESGAAVLAAAVECALDSAAHQPSAAVELLLAALPDPAAAVAALPVQLVTEVAAANGVELLQQLLAAAPGIASAQDPARDGQTPVMEAALRGCTQALAVLVEADPAAATQRNVFGQHPLQAAALRGSLPCIEVLLAVAPQLALATDDQGWTAAYGAALHGRRAALAALLRHEPAVATATNEDGWTPMHAAASKGHAAVVELLLAIAPQTAQAADATLWQPAHVAAQHGHANVIDLLLTAAPACALARNAGGWTPAHVAALSGRSTALASLLAAAPAAATTRTYEGHLPIDIAVELILDEALRPATVLPLLPHGDARQVLRALKAGGRQLLPLFADFVQARLPLAPHLWALLPAQCPGLGRALPAALAHSAGQAAALVSHLPPADRRRLQAAALCLGRAQRRLRCHLPQALVWHILSRFDD